MARAKRHYLPGHVWHITHRVIKRSFCLNLPEIDIDGCNGYLRQRNGMVSIHLLVVDGGGREVIPKSIQLIAGRTGHEYNQRKNRNGAFWEDRYHATAVSSDRHLIQCIVYIDLNMVRAGVVTHPSEWDFGGYNEIKKPRERYALIDYKRLMDLLHISKVNELRSSHKKWVEEILKTKNHVRESKWSQSIAVGNKNFIESIKEKLGIQAKGRKVKKSRDLYHLREAQAAYNSNFTPEMVVLRAKNTYFWSDNP